MTLPDFTEVNAGEQLIKTWEIKNIGGCTWTPAYQLVYNNGARVSAASITPFTKNILPGETVQISIPVIIPETTGRIQTYWYLISDTNQIVGTDTDGKPYLWFKAEVEPASSQTFNLTATPQPFVTLEALIPNPSGVILDLYSNACGAVWLSNNNPIPCPEFETNPFGVVQLVKDEPFENGEFTSDALLFALPASQSEVIVTGTYPQFVVQNGDKLTFRTGCLLNTPQCSALVFFYYINESGTREILWGVSEGQDGITSNVEIDLSFLQGQTISIQIEVSSLGESFDDSILISSPIILQSAVLFTPTAEPTFTPTATFTPAPTFTPLPTDTPIPTLTPAPKIEEEPQNFFDSIIQFFKDLFGIQ